MYETPKTTSKVICFMQPGHNYSNKDTPPSSAILYDIMCSCTSKLPHQFYLILFWVSMLLWFLTIINMVSCLGSLSYCMGLELEVSLVGHSQNFYTTNNQEQLGGRTNYQLKVLWLGWYPNLIAGRLA